jgi:hypothetical protein
VTPRFARPALASLDPINDPVGINRSGIATAVDVRFAIISQFATQPLAATLACAQLLGQLVAALVAVELILGLISRDRIGDDLPGDLVIVDVAVAVCVARHLGAVHRDHARPDQPRPLTQPQHRSEQATQRLLVAAQKPRDRRVIRHQIPADHPERDVLAAMRLDRPRGPLPGRERVEHQRDHLSSTGRRTAVGLGL